MSKEQKTYKKYSAEFKIGVIMDMRENHLSYHETARKYEIVNNSYGGALNTLKDLLKLSGMARSTFYYYLKNPIKDKYETEKNEITTIFAERKGRYGYRFNFIKS